MSNGSLDSGAVAVVGIACRFPGGIDGPDTFWRALCDGAELVADIPSNRIDVTRFFDPRPAIPGRMMSQRGGYLQQLEDFEPEFFSISPREAATMDPQQRVMLELAWEALEDAGQDVTALNGSRTSVFVGQWLNDFESRLFADPERVDFEMTTGSGRYATSGRLSYVFGLRGPSLTLDSACSSSLAAVHFAVRSIRSGESAMALAGGVNFILQPHISIAYSQSRMMAPDGRCKFGDAAGDGYVRSEGAGLVVLKALDRALADGDRIYAVVRGSAVNNDGQSSGAMGRPSPAGQEDVLRSAYGDAGVDPSAVTYIEAHGTGTRVGDPVELSALGAVLGPGRRAGSRCFVGSVKTNVGHTEGAAGVAGLIKVALSLHHGRIPASLHFSHPNPAVPWSSLPLTIPSVLTEWPRRDEPRTAGVSSFGIAGTNAHVVLQEAPAQPSSRRISSRRPKLLLLSARNEAALLDLVTRYAAHLEDTPESAMQDVCWTATARRTRLEHRAAFVAVDGAGMVAALRQYGEGGPPVARAVVAETTRPRVVFVFPGQGGQWPGMARELIRDEPVFRAAIERCDAAARRHVGWSILAQIEGGNGAPEPSDRIDVIQPVLLAVSIAYGEWLRALGVEPFAIVGHSMGEVGAAFLAGALTLDDAMRVICRRSALMRQTSGQGAMALVDLPMAVAAVRLESRRDRLAVAVSNSPRSCVVSGDPVALRELITELESEGVFCRGIKVDVASHSPQMDPVAVSLQQDLRDITPTEALRAVYSTVHAARVEGQVFDAGYWAANVRQPVRFGDTVEQLVRDGANVFVELGPHPILLPAVEQTASALGISVALTGCGRRDESDVTSFVHAIATLGCAGVPLDWSQVFPGGGLVVPVPTYPWQRERHWADVADLVPVEGRRRPVRLDDEMRSWLYRLAWTPAAIGPVSTPTARQWIVVATDAAAPATAVANALTAAGAEARVTSLDRLDFRQLFAADMLVVLPDADDAAYLPVHLVQQAVASGWRHHFWFVTRGAQCVTADEPGQVAQAAAWGSATVLAEEHPEYWGGLIDLPAGADDSAVAACAQHLLAADGEDRAAFRGGRRFVQRLSRLASQGPIQPPGIRPDAAYLITGGLGAIGLRIAHHLAERGARRLILLARRPLPARREWAGVDAGTIDGRRVRAVMGLEALGVSVHVADVDVSREDSLTPFLDRYRAEAWPPVRGVVHAAGSFANCLIGAMDRDAFNAVVLPKARGAQLLDRLLPDLDFFVMFSSTGAFLGQPGQANYAAANAALDAVAAERRARGLPAQSIGWGVWAGTGLVDDEQGARNVAEMERQGIQAFAPERGVALFEALSGGPEVAPIVLPIDWATFGRVRAGRPNTLFRDLLATGALGEPTGAMAVRLEGASPAERRILVDTAVRDAVCTVLRIAPTRLDRGKTLGSMGLTSLMAMELRNRLEASLGRSLSATLAWNHPTVEALVTYLSGTPAAPVAEPPAAAATVAEVAGDVADLSDEEAALALRRGRNRS